MKKTMSVDERIAYARHLRVTWHTCADGHQVYYWNRNGWRAGIVTQRGRVAVSVVAEDAAGTRPANPTGQAHRRRYEDVRWRMLDLKGKDAPIQPPSGATECKARIAAQRARRSLIVSLARKVNNQ